MEDLPNNCPFMALGFSYGANPTKREVTIAYHRQALNKHPDKKSDQSHEAKQDATDRLQILTEARVLLSEPRLRAAYLEGKWPAYRRVKIIVDKEEADRKQREEEKSKEEARRKREEEERLKEEFRRSECERLAEEGRRKTQEERARQEKEYNDSIEQSRRMVIGITKSRPKSPSLLEGFGFESSDPENDVINIESSDEETDWEEETEKFPDKTEDNFSDVQKRLDASNSRLTEMETIFATEKRNREMAENELKHCKEEREEEKTGYQNELINLKKQTKEDMRRLEEKLKESEEEVKKMRKLTVGLEMESNAREGENHKLLSDLARMTEERNRLQFENERLKDKLAKSEEFGHQMTIMETELRHRITMMEAELAKRTSVQNDLEEASRSKLLLIGIEREAFEAKLAKVTVELDVLKDENELLRRTTTLSLEASHEELENKAKELADMKEEVTRTRVAQTDLENMNKEAEEEVLRLKERIELSQGQAQVDILQTELKDLQLENKSIRKIIVRLETIIEELETKETERIVNQNELERQTADKIKQLELENVRLTSILDSAQVEERQETENEERNQDIPLPLPTTHKTKSSIPKRKILPKRKNKDPPPTSQKKRRQKSPTLQTCGFPDCGKEYNAKNMQKHKQTHQRDLWMCDACQGKFSRKDALQRHFRRYHT